MLLSFIYQNILMQFYFIHPSIFLSVFVLLSILFIYLSFSYGCQSIFFVIAVSKLISFTFNLSFCYDPPFFYIDYLSSNLLPLSVCLSFSFIYVYSSKFYIPSLSVFLLKVKLPYDHVCPSVGWLFSRLFGWSAGGSVGRSVG